MKKTYVNFKIVHLLAFGVIWYLGYYLAFIPVFISFIFVIFKDLQYKNKIQRELLSKEVLKREEDRKTGEWKNFKEDGHEFINNSHEYSSDLDIFGRASIFQKFNECKTYFGKILFKELLTNPDDEILKRQEAIKEIYENRELMTSLKTELSLNKEIASSPEKLIELFESSEKIFKNPLVKIVSVLFPTILVGSIIFTWFELFIVMLILNIASFLALFIFVSSSISPLYEFKKAMTNIKNITKILISVDFKAELNKEAKEILVNENALKNINKISFLAEAVNIRHNLILYLVLNLGLLWDINLAISLEELRGKINLEKWLKQIAHFEAMISLANVSMGDSVCVPKLTHENKLNAINLSHPLLENAVSNSITLDGIAIVSGSNMSGKTTFLRTIGTNLVLFYAGASVFASEFKGPKFKILTSMRIADNLEESISTFYAELIRIEKIVKASKTKERIIFLIDEIFRGTNSEDRITGAKKVLEQLNNNLGLITTHDLEVSNNFENKNGYVNLHFKEYYEDGKINFDYKMREGISTTRNAIFLMKLVGIE